METDEEFEHHRGHLLGVAYRLLGRVSDAEDAVQEAYLRLLRVDRTEIDDLRAWLTTVVGRICLDQLRSARMQREAYIGPWLPEPIVEDDPADRVTLDESVSMALLVVLESLTPAERTAFVLHDVFGLEFDAVAETVGRTPAACRQLASRARRHVRERSPRFGADRDEQARVAKAFAAATLGGDLGGLLQVLDPDVVLRSDGGGLISAARRPVVGAENVSRFLLGIARKGASPDVRVELRTVNGGPGLVLESPQGVFGVLGLAVADGRITAVDLVVNPEKLTHLTR